MENLIGKDFKPTAETISIHGLGFLQVKLPANKRLHVWHPDLPRRKCYAYSAVHNHRFSFKSTVLIGTQLNRRVNLIMHPEGTHDVISHDGPRHPTGSRESFVAGRVNLQLGRIEEYKPSESYHMAELEYHYTPNSGVVVTLMEKLTEGKIHATSLIERPHVFDQTFDRFQWSPARLWEIVVKALAQ